MNHSEIISISVSVISIIIALLALFQTNRQISLSNKQQLFDRRLSRYLEFNTIYSLYTENKLQLKDESTFYHTNDLVFSWLTNCADLGKMVLAVANPLHQNEQKTLLTKYEQLKNHAIEISIELDENGAPQQQAISIDIVSLCQDICEAALLYYRKNKEHFSFNYRIISASDRLANLFGYDNEINI